jgi:intergrase/recombinase
MKKILAFIICIVLICAMPLVVFAEGEGTESLPTEVTETSITDEIVSWIKGNPEEVSVICSLIISAFYSVRKHKMLNKSISATNLNAITVSENSERAMAEALEMMRGFKEASAEEKRKLQEALDTANNYLKASMLANKEFANELAELLVLANIPNSKKDELYARHIDAVKTIEETVKTIEENVALTEVIEDDNGNKE